MIQNELSRRLENAGSLEKLVMAIQNALALRRETGATIPELLRSALAMRRNQKLSQRPDDPRRQRADPGADRDERW